MKKEVFKAGKWTDSAGRTRKWTESDVDKMISAFNPSNREIPMVVGHPRTDSPAFGWVSRLWREGKGLWAEFKDVVGEMKTAIDKKMFKNTSISVNPKTFQINHIGFLGGAQPAVPGLGKIQLSADPDDSVIEYGAELPADPDFPLLENTDFFKYTAEHADGTVVQSLVFSKDKFPTEESVRQWITKNPQFKFI